MVGLSADVLIIVDVLSFSTCVDVATARGAAVYPCRWKDERARECAAQLGAELAGPRGSEGKFSLSPVTMRNAAEGTRIVLPSPNGSELTVEAQTLGRIVLTGCFRNCRAVAKYAAGLGASIAVIPAGERWPDGTLRPAVEDLAAAGAIIANLPGSMSPESSAAVAAWSDVKTRVGTFLASCTSGRELSERNFQEDIQIAAEVDISTAVPLFHEEAYVGAERVPK